MKQQGQLSIVSLGPGDLAYLAPAAQTALQRADVVIGYRFYLNLIRALLTPQQQIVDSELGEEMARANHALDLALQGQRVALVSSGDAGIYAMAGPVFEALTARGWTSDDASHGSSAGRGDCPRFLHDQPERSAYGVGHHHPADRGRRHR